MIQPVVQEVGTLPTRAFEGKKTLTGYDNFGTVRQAIARYIEV